MRRAGAVGRLRGTPVPGLRSYAWSAATLQGLLDEERPSEPRMPDTGNAGATGPEQTLPPRATAGVAIAGSIAARALSGICRIAPSAQRQGGQKTTVRPPRDHGRVGRDAFVGCAGPACKGRQSAHGRACRQRRPVWGHRRRSRAASQGGAGAARPGLVSDARARLPELSRRMSLRRPTFTAGRTACCGRAIVS